MVSFELGKEKKAFFVSSRAWDRENIFSPHEASEGLRFDASWGLRIFFFVPRLWRDEKYRTLFFLVYF